MTLSHPKHSLRIKLLVASLTVEIVMLAILVANSTRLIHEHLAGLAEARVALLQSSFGVALAGPLAARDYATLQAVLDGFARLQGVRYLTVADRSGKILAAAGGTDRTKMLPPPSGSIEGDGETYHAQSAISYLDQTFGTLHVGVDIGFLRQARREALFQGGAIAGLEILLSIGALALIGFFLTRHLVALTRAAEAVAAGDYDVGLTVDSTDEIGLLARSFTAMAATVRQRMDELAARDRQLSRANEELSRFALVAAHHLQEPTRQIVNYVDLLRRHMGGSLPAEAEKDISHIVTAGRRLRTLIADLHDYTALKTDPIPDTAVDVVACVEEFHARAGVEIAESGLDLRFAGQIPLVLGDPAQIRQLFGALLSNAVKYRALERLPTVVIAGFRENGFVHLTIADNGIGVPPDYQERVFRLFERLHSQDDLPGTGIGLALCRKIVERHGGKIWIETPKDRPGTTFHLLMPAATLGGPPAAGPVPLPS